MSSPAKYPSEVSQRMFDILTANKTTLVTAGWLADDEHSIMYGDQDRLHVTPMVCIEAGTTARAIGGVAPGGRLTNTFECYVLYYHSVVQDIQLNKKQSEQGAEAIASLFDSNLLLDLSGDGGIVIHGYFTSIDPGYSLKQGTFYRACRLTWNGITKTILGA